LIETHFYTPGGRKRLERTRAGGGGYQTQFLPKKLPRRESLSGDHAVLLGIVLYPHIDRKKT